MLSACVGPSFLKTNKVQHGKESGSCTMRVDAHAARPGCVDPADRALVKDARSVYQKSCTIPTIFSCPWRYLCTTETW